MFSTIEGEEAENDETTEMIRGEDEYMDIILLIMVMMKIMRMMMVMMQMSMTLMLITIKIAAPEEDNNNDDDDDRNQLSLLLLLVTIEATLDRTLCMLWRRKMEPRIDDLDDQRDCIKSSFLFSMADIFVGCC